MSVTTTDQKPPAKPADPETWAKSGKAVVEQAGDLMLARVNAQGRDWRSVTASDLIVAQGLEAVDMVAAARGMAPETVDVTHMDLLGALHAAARAEMKEKAAAAEKAKADAAKAEADAAKAEVAKPADAKPAAEVAAEKPAPAAAV